MDEKLTKTIDKIELLCKQNPEFDAELRKRLGVTASTIDDNVLISISDDVQVIRGVLEIRANVSISYDFVKHERLRDRLIVDNLRMENAALNLQQEEAERFYAFCVNAFYQLENIVNYYFYTTFPGIEELTDVVEEFTKQEKNEWFQYHKNGTEKNVGDIPIAHKINAFCNMLLPMDKSIKWVLGILRKVRNEGVHRCNAIRQGDNDESVLYNFLKTNTFNSVRVNLIRIANAAETFIGKPSMPFGQIEATISSMLPSICYVKYGNDTNPLPTKLFPKVKGLSNGDKVNLVIVNDIITDVIVS